MDLDCTSITVYKLQNVCSTTLHSNRYCLAYSMGALLEKELEEFVCSWSSHLIRSNSKARCPSGIPNDLFEMPETMVYQLARKQFCVHYGTLLPT